MDWTEFWRLTNAVLASVAFVLLLIRMIVRWKHWRPRLRMLSEALLAWTFTGAWGSVEQAMQHTEGGSRTALVSAACLLTIWALTWTEPVLEDEHESDYPDSR